MEQKKVVAFIYLKCNGKLTKTGIPFELPENLTKEHIREALMDEFELETLDSLQIFDVNGKELFDTDLCFLHNGDIIYYDLEGHHFDYGTIIKQYKILKKLGEGGYGRVMLAKHTTTKELVAIKYMDITSFKTRASKVNEIYREALAIKKLSHPNIVVLHHAFIYKQWIILIMDYYSGGELRQLISHNPDGCLQEIDARKIFERVVHAVNYCHVKFTIHRDIKPRNILFATKTDPTIKLIDFGIAGTVYQGEDKDWSGAGSLRYMAPEILNSFVSAADPSIDVWSLGILLFNMIFGDTPFGGKTSSEIAKNIKKQPLTFPLTKIISDPVRNLMIGMLDKSPYKRFTMYEIVNHLWFTIPEDKFAELHKNGEKAHNKRIKIEENKVVERLLKNSKYGLPSKGPSKLKTPQFKQQLSVEKNNSPLHKVRTPAKIGNNNSFAMKSKSPAHARRNSSMLGGEREREGLLAPMFKSKGNESNGVEEDKVQKFSCFRKESCQSNEK